MGLGGPSGVTVIQLQDRGDPAAFDTTEAALTMDGAWHDLDLSAIVADADASFVLLRVLAQDAAPGTTLHFRKNGNANAIAIQGMVCDVASQDMEGVFLVPCDTSQVIEYRASAAWDSIDIAVLGWVS